MEHGRPRPCSFAKLDGRDARRSIEQRSSQHGSFFNGLP
jgi:hypothetical protein